jgi:hypothetical protein
MTHTRITPVLSSILLAGLVLAGPWDAQAQARPAGPAATAPAQVVLDTATAEDLRRDFYEVLDKYPPALGRILRLDPSLLKNPDYLASYPQIAAFVAQHPQVAHNPGYYLERYAGTYSAETPFSPQQMGVQMWRDIIDFMGAFLVFVAVTSAIIYLIRYLVEYRRWHRIAKIQTEVHNKILDRFASNEDLLAYIQTPAGRRFLESAPISMDAGPKSVGAPYSRILWSVQVGVIVAVAAIGLMFVSTRAVPEVSSALFAVATLSLAIGVGFVVSAGVAYTLSRRMGLLEPPAAPPASRTQSPV